MTDSLAVRERKGRTETTDLPEHSHSPDHRLYRCEQFAGWQLSPDFDNPDRFNAFLALPAPA